jgi:hypothetical protein
MKIPLLSIVLPLMVFAVLIGSPYQTSAATQATSTFVVG